METTLQVAQSSAETEELVASFHASMERIREQVRRIIVGQDEVVDNLLVTLLVGGHCLITGMPGTAKTLLVSTLAAALGLTFKRIQFTPDLMPTDITGTDILEEDSGTGRRSWTFVQGPLFTNVLLADEVNRTPPKTQAALLEAMQEHSVTVRGNSYQLRPPFFVLATQNPIELEGTYPLPEAQLDRFLFNVLLDYLSPEQEVEVVDRNTAGTGSSPARLRTASITSPKLLREFVGSKPDRARCSADSSAVGSVNTRTDGPVVRIWAWSPWPSESTMSWASSIARSQRSP
jgi:MoxR-like ATPase